MQNEYGTITAPYAVEVDGVRAPVEVTVVINESYAERDGRFYMFTFDATKTQLDVSLDEVVRADTGQAMECYQRIPDPKEFKCTIDGRNMPPEGTTIRLIGTVGASRAGTFTMGALALPFTATWGKLQMSNGFDAELYAGTQVNVKTPTSDGGALDEVRQKLPVPTPGALGVAVAALGAAALVATRRR